MKVRICTPSANHTQVAVEVHLDPEKAISFLSLAWHHWRENQTTGLVTSEKGKWPPPMSKILGFPPLCGLNCLLPMNLCSKQSGASMR